jgi:hypothetical protein
MGVRVRVCFVAGMRVGDDVDPAMGHAARCEQLVRHALKLVASTAHHDDLHAAVLVEVHVKGRTHLIPQLVLELGELLGEIAHVMVVDEGQGGDGRATARNLDADDLGSHEIPQDLRSRHAPVGHDDVEVIEQRLLHGHAEADERITHAGNGSPIHGDDRPRGQKCAVKLARTCSGSTGWMTMPFTPAAGSGGSPRAASSASGMREGYA